MRKCELELEVIYDFQAKVFDGYLKCVVMFRAGDTVSTVREIYYSIRNCRTIHHISNLIVLHRYRFKIVSPVIPKVRCLVRRSALRNFNDVCDMA